MKDLINFVDESILDDEEEIMNKADLSASRSANAEWMKAHGCDAGFSSVLSNPTRYPNLIDIDTETWILDMNSLYIGKKDKKIPEYLYIRELGKLVLSEYPGETIPTFGGKLNTVKTLIIRDCPNLKSLVGCPPHVTTLSVSGCPNIKSLNGCSPDISKSFKFINNGISLKPKDINRVCKNVPKDKIIYDRPNHNS